MRAFLCGLASLSLTACTLFPVSQKRSDPLSAPADPTIRIQLYVVAGITPDMLEWRGHGPWTIAREFEVALEQAGFDAIVIDQRGEVPAGSPFAEHISYGNGRYESWSPWTDATIWTAGLIPSFADRHYGWSFTLHQQPDVQDERVEADWTVPVAAGWVAIPLWAFRGDTLTWNATLPDEAERAREVPALRIALLDALARQP